jgi:hypothetical protein
MSAQKLNRPPKGDIWLSRPRSSLFHRFSFHFSSVWERSDLPGVAAYLSVFTCMMLIKSIDNHSMPSIQVCNIYGADCLSQGILCTKHKQVNIFNVLACLLSVSLA